MCQQSPPAPPNPTTTANAQAVLEHMEFHHHTAWPDLDVKLTNVADQWAQFAVPGPKAPIARQLATSSS